MMVYVGGGKKKDPKQNRRGFGGNEQLKHDDMQKRFLLLVWLCVVATLGMHAQNYSVSDYNDYVYMKDGTVIRGVITEQVPGKHVKVLMLNGSLFVLEEEKIDKITKQPLMVSSQSVDSSHPATKEKVLETTFREEWKGVSVEVTEGDVSVLKRRGTFYLQCEYHGTDASHQGQSIELDDRKIDLLYDSLKKKVALRKEFATTWNRGTVGLKLSAVYAYLNHVYLTVEEQTSEDPRQTPVDVTLSFKGDAFTYKYCVLRFKGIVVDATNSLAYERVHKVLDAVLYQMRLIWQGMP